MRVGKGIKSHHPLAPRLPQVGNQGRMFYILFGLLFIAAVSGFPAASLAGKRIPVVRSTYKSNPALVRRITGDSPAILTADSGGYVGPVTIGNVTFPIILDTGSNTLWVYSTLTDSAPLGKPVYNPRTGIATNYTFSVEYGDSSTVDGVVYLDTVIFADIKFPKQAVGATRHVAGNILDTDVGGILGLGTGTFLINQAGSVPTLLQVLASSGVLDENLFTVALMRPNEPQSFFTFGYIDNALLNGATPVYTNVSTANGYWEFPSESIVVNGQRISRRGNTAFADTGTTLIELDPEVLPTLYKPLNGTFDSSSSQWIIPGDIPLSEYPTITLFAGETGITLPPEDLRWQPSGDGNYIGSIQSRGDNAPADVFGECWLKNTYAIHRFGTAHKDFQFGVVQRKPI